MKPKTKPTKEQIASEIDAIRALKPTGIWAQKTKASLAIAVDALNGQVDETAAEFDELTDDQRDVYYSARDWLNGDASERPSQGWEGLVE